MIFLKKQTNQLLQEYMNFKRCSEDIKDSLLFNKRSSWLAKYYTYGYKKRIFTSIFLYHKVLVGKCSKPSNKGTENKLILNPRLSKIIIFEISAPKC